MIKSFRHKGLRRLYEDDDASGISPAHRAKIRQILLLLNNVERIDQLDLPGFSLHQLQGNRRGIWSMKVTGNWRITFEFADGDAHHVDLEDYH